MKDYTYEREKELNSADIYETYEWDNTWIEHANDPNRRRVLYIGDSISCGVRRIATAYTNESILFDGFGTSKALDNPCFKDCIKLFLKQLPKVDAVIFNNGLHGWHLKEETDYKKLYEDMVRFLLEEIGEAKLFIVLTTSVKDIGRNNRVLVRNSAATEIAGRYSLPIIDLYTVTNKNINMLSDDGVHPNEELNKKIAAEIIHSLKAL